MSTRELPGWCRETDAGLEVGYSVICPDVCPPGLAELIAGRIEAGVFYPYGTVARCFFDAQRERNRREAIERPPHVYFVQAEWGGPVKIGLAENVDSRLAGLQTAHPYGLVVRRVLPFAGKAMEQRLHRRFAHCRLQGEWFEPVRELERRRWQPRCCLR